MKERKVSFGKSLIVFGGINGIPVRFESYMATV